MLLRVQDKDKKILKQGLFLFRNIEILIQGVWDFLFLHFLAVIDSVIITKPPISYMPCTWPRRNFKVFGRTKWGWNPQLPKCSSTIPLRPLMQCSTKKNLNWKPKAFSNTGFPLWIQLHLTIIWLKTITYQDWNLKKNDTFFVNCVVCLLFNFLSICIL